MKRSIGKIFLTISILAALASCVKDVNPSDSITTATITNTYEGIEDAVNGAYSLFKDHLEFAGSTDLNNMWLRQYFQCADFAGDDIVCGQTTTDPLYYSFSLNHTVSQTNTRYFWYISYKIINDANTVIESIQNSSTTQTDSVKQLLGECYFLRAFVHFSLCNLFARPYSQGSTGDGIILRTSTTDPTQKARSSIGDVYKSVISDAQTGMSLMNASRGVMYATKEAAMALLSRVYLYKGDADSTIYYSNQVINSNKFSLTTSTTYPAMFANATSASETIFCIAFTTIDDYGKNGSIASMIYSDGNSGWGEEYASQSLRDTMSAHPEDVRWSYISPNTVDGVIQTKNGVPMYYITKFSFQGGSPTLSSPILFRLAEMYLNRAEAEAKTGQTAAALDDIDLIRKNRGLDASLYNGVLPSGKTVIDVVLKERRLELAFEGMRSYDVYRNNLKLNRTYWGYHLPGLQASDINLAVLPTGYENMIVDPTDTRIIYYIPIDEIQNNALCTQNP
ncbi:RagB/SusD family nutrient uptake outer membrane protein [Rhizosphaericola mali]|uniref:RagB/SusD family nutrient uptake outer membrane protein n=1 Tax=Rhizosphaericola mali TaxID=2545455 RepID=A0A5P2GBV6_9BACT|nr:RagB/SusD family nutrient uptake outer membrane protein [Rhizosphaericola mali]QES90693.1 RagB/SusD family nutrient uptake outer membrane protein [Rhizosphaericola mali]